MIFRSGLSVLSGFALVVSTTAGACGGVVGDDSSTGGGASDASTSSDAGHASDASTCTGAADCKCGTASCVGGEWRCPKSCGCPDSLAGLDGTSCDVDGLSCSGDCSNPCNFCNILECTNGTWTTLEAFPEPCVDGSVVDGG